MIDYNKIKEGEILYCVKFAGQNKPLDAFIAYVESVGKTINTGNIEVIVRTLKDDDKHNAFEKVCGKKISFKENEWNAFDLSANITELFHEEKEAIQKIEEIQKMCELDLVRQFEDTKKRLEIDRCHTAKKYICKRDKEENNKNDPNKKFCKRCNKWIDLCDYSDREDKCKICFKIDILN